MKTGTDKTSLLVARDVVFVYPGSSVPVFQPVTLSVHPGQYLRIDGRNGSGKTTLLKLLAQVFDPSSGSMVLSPDVQVALMNQDSGASLSPELTIAQHLKCFSPNGSDRHALGNLKAFDLGLDSMGDEFVGHLSGGQRQIIALACALVSHCSVLCLDEYMSALDKRAAVVAERLIEEAVISRGVAVVYVSHKDNVAIAERENHHTVTVLPHE